LAAAGMATAGVDTDKGPVHRRGQITQLICTVGVPAPTVAGCLAAELRNGTGGVIEAHYVALPGYDGGGVLLCQQGNWAVAVDGYPRCTSIGCMDDASYSSEPMKTPCSRTSWEQCSTNQDIESIHAAVACPLACGTCGLSTGLPTGQPCIDDPSWRASTNGVGAGWSCLSLETQRMRNRNWDPRLRCPLLRSAHRSAIQACPRACGLCGGDGNTTASAAAAHAALTAAGTTPNSTTSTGTADSPSEIGASGANDLLVFTQRPPPPPPVAGLEPLQIRLRTPAGTQLPIRFDAPQTPKTQQVQLL
jgi:hypothetical protein